MISPKFTSVKQIIDKFYNDSTIQDEVPYSDLVQWISDALLFIDQNPQFERKVTGTTEFSVPDLDIVNFKAQLPCDLYRIEQIMVNGQAARYSSNTMHHALLAPACCGPIDECNIAHTQTDNFGNEFITSYHNYWNSLSCSDITYDINKDCITLSIPKGKVKIAYLAIPTDEEGFPLIPDDISYLEAINTYLMYKIDYQNWRRNPDSAGYRALYEDSDKKWCWYVAQAKSKAKMLSLDQMETLRNSTIRLLHKSTHHRNFFNSLGNQEFIKKH
jgi:hypothetical protein